MERNFDRALQYFKKAVELGDEQAPEIYNMVLQNQLIEEGVEARESGESELAYLLFSEAAQYQNHVALLYCGIMNISGEGMERDLEKAQDYLERAAEMGNEDAMQILQKLPGEKLLDEGRIAVEMGEYERAFAIYDKLAKAESADGMFNFGIMFARGVGVEKDMEKAQQYLEMAASMGSVQAANILEKVG
ncbi:hypothetical protein [Sporofaciens sp. SGI.106]|uniref:tetratricopeptide repeat protein n=1 Tax=Sporofaciens sp. SGI.106 TaxID=3420568 RepID=UPI003D02B760